jgi:hypothetical protein
MILVETLRLRRWTIGWAAVILVVAVGIVAAVQHAITTVEVNGSNWSALNVPLVAFAPLAMFLSMIYASGAGLSLNVERQTLALSWTKPLSRVAVALRIVAVDVAAIVASNVFAWIVILSVIVSARGSVIVGPSTFSVMVASLGVAIMWYALIVALTSMLPGSGGMVMGLLWPAALLISQLRGQIGGVFGTIVLALNVINPLAYMNLQISSDATSSSSTMAPNSGLAYWQAPVDERAALVCLLSVVLIAIGVAIWTRREA